MLQGEVSDDGLLIGNQDHVPSTEFSVKRPPLRDRVAVVLCCEGLADSIGDRSSWLGTVWIFQIGSRFQDLGLWKKFFFWDGLVWNLRGSGCLYFKVSLYNRESVCALLKIF